MQMSIVARVVRPVPGSFTKAPGETESAMPRQIMWTNRTYSES